MVGRLLVELKQTKPFRSRADEAYINIIRTADHLRRMVIETLKPYELSPAQYNVLRILRGAQSHPITCGEVCSRLVTFEPDLTRLVNKLVARDLVKRTRCTDDKRQVLLTITAKGLALLKKLDEPISTVHARELHHMSDERLSSLITTLEDIRLGSSSSPTESS